jgi:hypothetical protein
VIGIKVPAKPIGGGSISLESENADPHRLLTVYLTTDSFTMLSTSEPKVYVSKT